LHARALGTPLATYLLPSHLEPAMLARLIGILMFAAAVAASAQPAPPVRTGGGSKAIRATS
jgi:hypothetical protein